VEVKYYEFIYDKVPGRRQIGILGPDAQKWFPESVEIIANYSFPRRDRSQPAVSIPNFPVIDKNVIFFHGIAALQELARHYELLSSRAQRVSEEIQELHSLIQVYKRNAAVELDARVVERAKLAQAELALAAKELELVDLKAEDEKLAIDRFNYFIIIIRSSRALNIKEAARGALSA
jgi:hypothetical protein